jgi:hypothetical protein
LRKRDWNEFFRFNLKIKKQASYHMKMRPGRRRVMTKIFQSNPPIGSGEAQAETIPVMPTLISQVETKPKINTIAFEIMPYPPFSIPSAGMVQIKIQTPRVNVINKHTTS